VGGTENVQFCTSAARVQRLACRAISVTAELLVNNSHHRYKYDADNGTPFQSQLSDCIGYTRRKKVARSMKRIQIDSSSG